MSLLKNIFRPLRARLLIPVLGLLPASGGMGNVFEMVMATGVTGGDAVWKVVTQSERRDTDLLPGIYTRGPLQNWEHPLVLGQILGREHASGLVQLSLTEYTNRLEAFGVIDGKITFFTTDSDAEDDGTVVRVGEGKYSLTDPGQPFLREVRLPPVKSLDDLSYQILEPSGYPRNQNILFSVRNPYSPFEGMDGLTFILTVKGSSAKKGGLELSGPPLVLDYQFHKSEELSDLEVEEGYVALSYANRLAFEQSSDSVAVKSWRQRLRQNLSEKSFGSIPRLNPENGKFTLAPARSFSVFKGSSWPYMKADAFFSVEGGLPGFKLERRDDEKIFTGQIDFYPQSVKSAQVPDLDHLGEHAIFVSADDDSCMFYLEGELYFVRADSKGRFTTLKINDAPLKGVLPNRMNYYLLESQKDLRIFVSAASDEKQETRVYGLLKVNSDLVVKDSFRAAPRFYAGKELKQRVYQEEDILYFDDVTDSGSQSYASAYDDTIAHIDVEKSLSNQEPAIGFRKPVKARILGEKSRYFYYNQNGLTKNTNGLYFTEKNGRANLLRRGELLFKKPKESLEDDMSGLTPEGEPALMSQKVRVGGSTVSITAVALDEKFEGGEESFSLALITEYESRGADPEVQILKVSRPFKSLSGTLSHGAQCPEKARGNYVGLLLSFFPEEMDSKSQDVIKVDVFLTDKDQAGSREAPVQIRLTQKQISVPGKVPGKDITDSLRDTLLSNVAVLSDGGQIKNVVYGQILKPKTSVSMQPVSGAATTLAQRDFVHPEWGSASVRVWAIDEDFNSGAESFTLVFEAKRQESGKTEYYYKRFNQPVAALTGLTLMDRSEFGSFRDWFGVIYAMDFEAGKKREKPGFFNLFFTIKAKGKKSEQDNIYFSKVTESQQEQVEHPSMEELEYKLLMDHEGRLYWPSNEFAQSHRKFQALSLFEGKQVLPNQERIRLESANRVSELVSYRVEEGSWRVRKAPYLPPLLPGIFSRLDKEEHDEYQNVIFEDLRLHFEELGNPDAEKEHSMLLVSKEGKRYVMNSFAAKWLNRKNQDSFWSADNRRLALYYLNRDQILDQGVVARNFLAAEQALERKEKVVILVDAADIIAAGKLKEGGVDKPYVISVPEEKNGSDHNGSLNQLFPDSEVGFKEETASLLYILGSEGRIIPLREFQNRGRPEISMTIVATDDEWDQITRGISPFERNAGLLKDFQVKTLETPSMEQRRNLLLKVLEDKTPLFNGVRYDGHKIFVSHKALSEEEIRNKVIDYAVSRAQALAMEKGENVFVSFVRLLEKFKSALHPGAAGEEDGVLVVDKAFIENLMRVLYNLALNLNTLPPSDPLKILERKDAPLKLNEAGYAGNFDIKMRVIRGLLAQTNSGDQKTIPASFVIFGKKGSGKTFLFRTLVKMLGLKYYDFTASEEVNRGAQVFMFNMGNITSRGSLSGDSETMSVDSLLLKFDGFLKSPLGNRGFILVDDAHLASSEVRGMIFSKLRSLFEAKDGMYQGVSVRNLALFMTFNPTIDRDKISKVVESGKPTPLQLTLATFMGEDNKVDESFFNRWGDIINLDYFSTSAKGNELVNKLSDTAKSHFSLENTYFTVTPDVISNIVETFPRLNARDFLSSSVKSLLEMLRGGSEYNSLYLIVPRAKIPFRGHWQTEPHSLSGESGSEDVAEFIENNFYGLPVKGDLRGYVWFLEMITHNFRVNLYRQLVAGLNGNQSMSGTEFSQKHKLAPVLEAVRDHLKENIKIPLTEYSLDQYLVKKYLGVSQFESVERFIYDMYKDAESQSYFPSVFRRNTQSDHLASYLLGDVSDLSNQLSRLNLLSKFPKGLKAPLEEYLMNLMRVASKNDLQPKKIQEWAEKLPGSDSRQPSKTSQLLASDLNDFLEAFFNDLRLIENMRPESYEAASFYDCTRIWLYILDKSITMMSWEQISVWLIRVLDTLSQDMSISTNPGVQHWLFESSETIIRPASSEGIFESVKSSLIGVGEWDQEERERFRKEFYSKLGSLFFKAER